MSKKRRFQLRELSSIHADFVRVFILMVLLTLCLLAYMGIRFSLRSEPMSPMDLRGMCFFGAACVALCIAQTQCLVRVIRDTSRRIERIAAIDALTEAYNYRFTHQRLAEEFSRAVRHHSPLSLLYCDLDHFKPINDTLGHDAGDMLLRRFAESARAILREEDFVGRLGGDEFLLVLPMTDQPGALAVAERVQKEFGKPDPSRPTEQGLGGSVSVSVGIASYPGDAATKDDLLRSADRAMYVAKSKGGGRCQAGSSAPAFTGDPPPPSPAQPHTPVRCGG